MLRALGTFFFLVRWHHRPGLVNRPAPLLARRRLPTPAPFATKAVGAIAQGWSTAQPRCLPVGASRPDIVYAVWMANVRENGLFLLLEYGAEIMYNGGRRQEGGKIDGEETNT